MYTDHLQIRPPEEKDRDQFVDLLCDKEFMEYSVNGAFQDQEQASAHFSGMLIAAEELPFAEQPLMEKTKSEIIIGYVGATLFRFEDENRIEERLEFNCRLVPRARDKKYSTEAARALLAKAAETFQGEMLARVRHDNRKAQIALERLDFTFWKPKQYVERAGTHAAREATYRIYRRQISTH
jgi:RimJ/RimL family protein N-acetyltransferase